jgi:phosphoribosylformylglycinamidine synthase
MKSCVIVFPASNCDRDGAVALEQATGQKPDMIWHGDTDLPETDFILLPGGFSYGDYLRSGAMASRSPIMAEVIKRAEAGVPVMGICNGFQVLTEAGLLPGALMRNAGLEFVCGTETLKVVNAGTKFTGGLGNKPYVDFPVAHHDGNYTADEETLNRLEGDGRVAFKYVANPNGSARDIAGIVNEKGNVLGMMPHPERVISPVLDGEDGAAMFKGIFDTL